RICFARSVRRIEGSGAPWGSKGRRRRWVLHAPTGGCHAPQQAGWFGEAGGRTRPLGRPASHWTSVPKCFPFARWEALCDARRGEAGRLAGGVAKSFPSCLREAIWDAWCVARTASGLERLLVDPVGLVPPGAHRLDGPVHQLVVLGGPAELRPV